MLNNLVKGESRRKKELARKLYGEPKRNKEANQSHNPPGSRGKAVRKKGKNRFKTGKKRQSGG